MRRIIFALACCTFLAGPSVIAQNNPPICSSEGSCTCGSGLSLACTSGGGACQAGQSCKPDCSNGQQPVCMGNTFTCPTAPGSVCMGTPPGANGCANVFDLDINGSYGSIAQVGAYVNNTAPACLHTLGGNCLAYANTQSPPPWYTGTYGSYHAHAFRACMVGPGGLNYPGGDNAYAIAGYPYVYLNDSCQLIGTSTKIQDAPAGYNLCGGILFTAQASPISLVFDDSHDVDAEQSIVAFPLELGNSKGQLYTWKASEKAPLLVFDPKQTGQITSASQLFGDWTFGGKRLASLVDSAISTKWRDGYEALASMDSNNDHKISGEELRNLALWSDVNQNGISEDGEVQSLASHGVKELYYQTDRRDEVTKNIYASRGFMRVVDGKETIGSSVDWYAARGQP